MPTTIFLSVRGDGSWRMLESFRRALGQEAASLVVHSNRDESGFYGSADVNDPTAAREAFNAARQPFPGLKAYLGTVSREREEPVRATPAPRNSVVRGNARATEPRESRTRERASERKREPAPAPEQPPRPNRRAPLRRRNRNERRPAAGSDQPPVA
ncbi:MAG: hypothetical protein ACTHMR_02775 [Thermomicrobiales bacterium]